MDITRIDELTSDLCSEIDFLRKELLETRAERDDWKNKYDVLLDSSLKECQRTTGAVLMLALKGALKLPESTIHSNQNENSHQP